MLLNSNKVEEPSVDEDKLCRLIHEMDEVFEELFTEEDIQKISKDRIAE